MQFPQLEASRSAAVPPGGYRSSVAYNAEGKTWITVGPTGTDIISIDRGRSSRPQSRHRESPLTSICNRVNRARRRQSREYPLGRDSPNIRSLATPFRRWGSSCAIGDGGVTEDGAMGTACGGCGDDLARQP